MPPKEEIKPRKNWCFVLNERSTMRHPNNQLYNCPLVKVDFEELKRARADGKTIDGDIINVNRSVKLPDSVECLVCQLEVGPKTGTIHLQGMVDLHEGMSFLQLKGGTLACLFGNGNEINWSGRRSTKLNNIRYCSKEDSRMPKTQPLKLGNVNDEMDSMLMTMRGKGEEEGDAVQLGTTIPKRDGGEQHRKLLMDARESKKRARDQEKKEHLIEESKILMEIWDYGVRNVKEFAEIAIHVRGIAMKLAMESDAEAALASDVDQQQQQRQREEKDVRQKAYSRILGKFLTNSRPLQLEYQGYMMQQERFRVLNAELNMRDVIVKAFIGPPGTGKTYTAMEHYAGLGVYVKDMQQRWWNGYMPAVHKVVVLDDFHGHNPRKPNAIFTPEFCQRLLDGTPLKLDRKFESQADAAYGMVVITTNLEFEEWFDCWSLVPKAVMLSIKSRIGDNFVYFKGDDKRSLIVKHMPAEWKKTVVRRVSAFTGQEIVAEPQQQQEVSTGKNMAKVAATAAEFLD